MSYVAIANDFVMLFRFMGDISAATATASTHNQSCYNKNDTWHSDGQVRGIY